MKLCSSLLILALPICAAPQTNRKAWTLWTMQDARKILNDSPWGQTQVGSNMAYPEYGMSVSRVNLRIRLFSAKPIRQAFLRILQLSETRGAGSDIDQAVALANRNFSDQIVVSVDCDAPPGALPPRAYMQAFANASTDSLKNNTYLETSTGKRCFLQQYFPPGPDGVGARFVFPRRAGDQLFVSSADKYVRFYSEFPKLADTTMTTGAPGAKMITFVLDMRFKIADLTYEGVVEY